nr:dTDP-4-dehydrorhamnose reductase [Winogradskyella ursingii]
MKTILVTGKGGQLAQCIRDASSKYSNFKFIFKSSTELDITNNIKVNSFFSSVYKIDYCINCAAYTAVDKAETNIDEAIEVNIEGPKNLANACLKNGAILIHISTDFVFDGKRSIPYAENSKTNPLGIYGKTKLEGENIVTEILDQHFIIRTSWLYSEYGSNFVKTMLNLVQKKDELSIVGDQIGSPTYAKNLADAILKFVYTQSNNYGMYHFSNRGQCSWHDFAKEVFNLSNNKIKLNKILSKAYPTPAIRPNYSVLDSSKIQRELNIEIPNWKESLAQCIGNLTSKNNLNIAIKAALDAGKAIMKIYDSEIAVEYKDDKSPLTEADKNANAVINSYLRNTEFPIISEENKQTDYSIRKTWETCWIVDPVDGTKEFIKRNGEFTVNIALVKNGQPVLGVIYVPVTKTLYVGNVEEKQAFKKVLDSHDMEISKIFETVESLNKSNSAKSKIRVVGSRSHMNQETLDYVEDLKAQKNNVEIVSKGSSLKFCLIAEGEADIYPRFAPTMEWDTAAGQAICNAVGVQVISKETNKPLLYNKENLLNPWFIVS